VRAGNEQGKREGRREPSSLGRPAGRFSHQPFSQQRLQHTVIFIRLWARRGRMFSPLLTVTTVTIHKLIANGSFGPDEIEVMKAAYEAALIDVGVTNPDEPIAELIAKSIVNVTATGERNPKEVMERALNALGVRRSAA